MLPLIIIINLERDILRREHMETQLKKYKIYNYIFAKAINGHNLDYHNINKSILSQVAIEQILYKDQRHGLTLSPGGAGLYYTWYDLINKYKNCHDIIIFEDDITLSHNFIEELQNAYKNIPYDYDILYLGSHQSKDIEKEHSNLKTKYFIKLNNRQVNGTFGIILSKNGLNKIQQTCFPANDIQIDTLLYMNFNTLNCYHLIKPIVKCNNNFDSNIQVNMDIFSAFKNLEIHILICNKDFTMGLESITSLLAYDEFKYVDIYYHDDGTLTSIQLQILQDKNFNIIKKDNNNMIKKKLEDYKECYNYRFMNKPYSFWHKIKLFDYFLLSKTKQILGLDTDILFIKKPTEIIKLIKKRKSFYMTDCKTSYCFKGTVNTTLEGVLERVNTGIIYIDNELDYNINLIEEGLKQIIIDDSNYFPSWIEQSAFAYMFSKLNSYTALDSNKYKFPYFQNCENKDIEALHFVSYPPCRNMWKQYLCALNFKNNKSKKLIETIEKNVIFNVLNPMHPNNSNLLEYNTSIFLKIDVYAENEKYFALSFNWGLPKNKSLSHIFKINDIEYSYGSELEGVVYFEKSKDPIHIYHTYEWYGSMNWELIRIINK